MAEKKNVLPHTMKVGKESTRPMEINIDPRLQEDESTVGPIEEPNEVQVDPSEPSRVVKICKGLQEKLVQQRTKFLC